MYCPRHLQASDQRLGFGDGAFQMTGWELGNCRRYGLEPIVLLFNNKSWEMLRVFQPESACVADWSSQAGKGSGEPDPNGGGSPGGVTGGPLTSSPRAGPVRA